jgi:hypothetical protein
MIGKAALRVEGPRALRIAKPSNKTPETYLDREYAVKDHGKPIWLLDVPVSEDEQRQNCLVDRRSGFDRRRTYSLDYFANGGIERRRGGDRREHHERRGLWQMQGMPCSVTSS